MALELLTDQEIEGVVFGRPRTVEYRRGWLFVQECEGWMEDAPWDRATALFVYRSKLVKPTSNMYRAVADKILLGEDVLLICEGRIEDPQVMGEEAIYQLFRIGPDDYDKAIIDAVRELFVRSLCGESRLVGPWRTAE